MKIYYIKIDNQNIIRDALNYPYDGYVQINVKELPAGSYAGYYKYIDNNIVFDEILFREYVNSIKSDKHKIELLNKYNLR